MKDRLQDEEQLGLLTDACRLLNEDLIIEKIRQQMNVTYQSRKLEEESDYTQSFIQLKKSTIVVTYQQVNEEQNAIQIKQTRRQVNSELIIQAEESSDDLRDYIDKLKQLKVKLDNFYFDGLLDDAMLTLNQMKDLKIELIKQHSQMESQIHSIWAEIDNSDPLSVITATNRDYQEMLKITDRLDSHEGYQLVKENKKNNVQMWYKKEDGERFVTLKFTVDRIKIPFFNLISLLYETDLYHHWFPFCKQSFDYMKIRKTCKVCYQELVFPFPLKNREAIVCGFGVNRMSHNGTVLVMSKSLREVDDPLIHQKVGVFSSDRRPEGLVENVIHFYGFEISPVSPTELSLRCCMLVDPQISFIPDAMINYASKKFGDDMINKLL